MIRRKIFSFLPIAVLAAPMLVFAAPKTFSELADLLIRHINAAALVLISATVVLYLYKTARDLFNISQGKAEENIARARRALLEGLGIIFVMVSIWGILNLIIASLSL